MLSGRKSRRGNKARGLIIVRLMEVQQESLSDLREYLEGHGMRYSRNNVSLGQTIRPLVLKGILMRISEYPNPIYRIDENFVPGVNPP